MDMKAKIISTYRELSQSKGFYNVTMDELASRAGMSKRTVYRYFTSKEEIIEAVVDDFLNGMARQVEVFLAEDKRPEVIFPKMVKFLTQSGRFIFNPLVLEDLRQQYPDLWAKIDQFRAEKIQYIFESIIMVEGEKGKIKELDPKIISTAILASVQAVINPAFILDHNLTIEKAAGQLIQLFLYGFVDKQ